MCTSANTICRCEHMLVLVFLVQNSGTHVSVDIGWETSSSRRLNVQKFAHSYIVMCLDLALNKTISSLLESDMFSLCDLYDMSSRLGRFFRAITSQGTHDQICWHDDGDFTLSHTRAFTTTTPAPFRDIRYVVICRWYTCTHRFPGTAHG